MILTEVTLSVQQLLLDPNNFRFHDREDFVAAGEARFHEQSVQDRAYRRLRDDEALVTLKNSILKNTYLPTEKIIVRPYSAQPDKHVVVEGNRRLAAVRWILEDAAAGAEYPSEVIRSIERIPVIVIQGGGVNPNLLTVSLMGIRHVSGVREWGGYQQAKLIIQMKDELGLSPGEVAERLGVSTREVLRRYRAFKALEQLRDHEEFGAHFSPKLYRLFHEAMSSPRIRDEWLDWNEESFTFPESPELRQFYSLITPRDPEIAGTSEPKITTYTQIRQLAQVLDHPQATRVLLEDPTTDISEAIAIVRRDELTRKWIEDVQAAIQALEAMGIGELKNLSEEDKKQLEHLEKLVRERLSDFATLTKATEREEKEK